MKNKIQIKTIYGKILFEFEKENNTIKDTLEEAVKNEVSLNNADLIGTDLYGADLQGANLSGADFRNAGLSDANLSDANLSGADLSDAHLYCADLNGAILCCAYLSNANLSCANLHNAILSGADLSGAYLRDANLKGADLRDANLEGANLRGADLEGANLRGANIKGANLHNAILKGTKMPDSPMACPESGSFIGWKKVKDTSFNSYLIKLEITEDAKRCSATSNKCRCDKAKVLEIIKLRTGENITEITNHKYAICTYRVGEMVYPDSFDENRWHECSNGIHFFINKQDALDY